MFLSHLGVPEPSTCICGGVEKPFISLIASVKASIFKGFKSTLSAPQSRKCSTSEGSPVERRIERNRSDQSRVEQCKAQKRKRHEERKVDRILIDYYA